MYRPRRIIDSHIHLVTRTTRQARVEAMARLDPLLVRAYEERWAQSLGSRNEDLPEDRPAEVDAVAERWEAELEHAGIERAVFFTSVETHDEVARFVSLNPPRFVGYLTFNPTFAANAGLLETMIRRKGIRGLKLYPMAQHFRVNDPACFPVYEVCQSCRVPVIIHFGLSINATHDLTFGNPLDLSTPAVRFPGVTWIIPHFGAGLFQESLLVAAQYRNVCIDTSSSNNWIQYSAAKLQLEDVFRRTYEALGAGKILFGTDSSFFPRGFRRNILEQQLSIWNSIGLTEAEMNDVFCGNIERILNRCQAGPQL